jgi:hypothetical protein
MDEQQLFQKAKDLDDAGKARYGDNWSRMIDALGKTGQAAAVQQLVLSQSDPTEAIGHLGKQALLLRADALAPKGDTFVDSGEQPDRAASAAYSEIRIAERERHRKLRGRT